jgi:ankyrin repeat protein
VALGPGPGDAGGYAPLYRAALDGDPATAERLLAEGADPNWHNEDNRWTALMVAVAEGYDAVATTLLADPRLEVDARDERGRTALHLAAERGEAELASRLAQVADVNAKDDEGVTPLMRAAFAGAAGVVAALLNRAEIEPNCVDRDRRTALHWAVMGGDAAAVRLLLEDPRTNPAITDRPDGSAARDLAAVAGRDDLLALLDERRADGHADELPAGEAWSPRPPEPPPFSERPIRPEPPRRERSR